MYLFFDTETTGFPPSARICQLAALLTDKDGNEIKRLNSLVKPDNWTIPEKVIAIHGKTNEMCEAEGSPMLELLDEFFKMLRDSRVVIAHNISFDNKMIGIECEYYNQKWLTLGLVYYCTMEKSKNILKLPHARYGYKNPKLIEAYRYFFGKDFDNAHDAMADVMACRDVFFKLMELQNGGMAQIS